MKIDQMPIKKNGLVLMALALLATPALSAQHKDPTSGCAVVAPSYLASSDYIFQYQGGCEAGRAEGKGKATWTLRYSPQNHVVWEGAFSTGVYLPPPAGIVSAREWGGPNSSDTVVFDMGTLPAQSGIPAARLKVLATSELTNYADPCTPSTLWVTNAPVAAMVSDSAAQSLLVAAADKLKARCGAQLAVQRKREGGDLARIDLAVRAVSTPDLESDRYGNPGPVLADAVIPLSPGKPIQQYSNKAASEQREQQQQVKVQEQRQANAQRLRAFFGAHQAQGWANLDDIAQNPFRYAGRVVVTAVELGRVISPTRATVYAQSDGWYGARALLDGEEVAQWKPGARLLAVRVLGRIKEGDDSFGGWAQLQLVGSQDCTQSRCADWLNLPVRLQDGQVP